MTGEELARLVSGPFLAACALLAVAGGAKLLRPANAGPAARALRLPSGPTAARALGAIELGVALAGVMFGGWAAVAVAAGYGMLAVASFALWRTAPATPCGCIGASSTTPASAGHVVVNTLAALIGAAAAAGGSPLRVVADQPLLGVPFVALTALAAWLAALTLDALPALRVAVREGNS